MSKIKRIVSAGVLILMILSIPVLAVRHYTNFGKPYLAESHGTSVKYGIWYFRGWKLFHATHERDGMNRWEAAEVHTFFERKTLVYCRDGQVRAMVEDGKLIFLEDPEKSFPGGVDVRPKLGKLMMESVKRLLNIEEEESEPKDLSKPSHRS